MPRPDCDGANPGIAASDTGGTLPIADAAINGTMVIPDRIPARSAIGEGHHMKIAALGAPQADRVSLTRGESSGDDRRARSFAWGIWPLVAARAFRDVLVRGSRIALIEDWTCIDVISRRDDLTIQEIALPLPAPEAVLLPSLQLRLDRQTDDRFDSDLPGAFDLQAASVWRDLSALLPQACCDRQLDEAGGRMV
jgi:hypothetical protein